jgi:hypothetical protein
MEKGQLYRIYEKPISGNQNPTIKSQIRAGSARIYRVGYHTPHQKEASVCPKYPEPLYLNMFSVSFGKYMRIGFVRPALAVIGTRIFIGINW